MNEGGNGELHTNLNQPDEDAHDQAPATNETPQVETARLDAQIPQLDVLGPEQEQRVEGARNFFQRMDDRVNRVGEKVAARLNADPNRNLFKNVMLGVRTLVGDLALPTLADAAGEITRHTPRLLEASSLAFRSLGIEMQGKVLSGLVLTAGALVGGPVLGPSLIAIGTTTLTIKSVQALRHRQTMDMANLQQKGEKQEVRVGELQGKAFLLKEKTKEGSGTITGELRNIPTNVNLAITKRLEQFNQTRLDKTNARMETLEDRNVQLLGEDGLTRRAYEYRRTGEVNNILEEIERMNFQLDTADLSEEDRRALMARVNELNRQIGEINTTYDDKLANLGPTSEQVVAQITRETLNTAREAINQRVAEATRYMRSVIGDASQYTQTQIQNLRNSVQQLIQDMGNSPEADSLRQTLADLNDVIRAAGSDQRTRI